MAVQEVTFDAGSHVIVQVPCRRILGVATMAVHAVYLADDTRIGVSSATLSGAVLSITGGG